MSDAPLISIVIPVYNGEAFIEETLRSVLKQTYRNLEVIVVDDGSKDRTALIVKKVVAEDSRVRYLYKENQGQSAARNHGLGEAKGEYVSFLDADNLLLHHACETFVKTAKQHDADVYYADIRYFDDAEPEKLKKFLLHYASEVTLETLVEHNFINLLGTFLKRKKVDRSGGFRDAFRRADEHYLWLALALQGAIFFYIDNVFGHLRFHRANLSFQATYWTETADTNVLLFDWLERQIKLMKSISPERFAILHEKIAHARREWFFKGFAGSLIIKDKSRARRYLREWRAHGGSSFLFYVFLLCAAIVPAGMLSRALSWIRYRAVMRKYEPVSSRD